MADKLGKLMQALEAGKVKEGLPALPKAASGAKGSRKVDLNHSWKNTAFNTTGSARAKKRGSGKH